MLIVLLVFTVLGNFADRILNQGTIPTRERSLKLVHSDSVFLLVVTGT